MSKKDLTEIPGNLSSDIHDKYGELLAIQDLAVLKPILIEMADARHNKGLSERNYRKFRGDLDRCGDDCMEVIKYITNYMLRGAGMGTS